MQWQKLLVMCVALAWSGDPLSADQYPTYHREGYGTENKHEDIDIDKDGHLTTGNNIQDMNTSAGDVGDITWQRSFSDEFDKRDALTVHKVMLIETRYLIVLNTIPWFAICVFGLVMATYNFVKGDEFTRFDDLSINNFQYRLLYRDSKKAINDQIAKWLVIVMGSLTLLFFENLLIPYDVTLHYKIIIYIANLLIGLLAVGWFWKHQQDLNREIRKTCRKLEKLKRKRAENIPILLVTEIPAEKGPSRDYLKPSQN